MPKMQANIAISRTTRRFLKQSATNWSIIEPHPTLHHHALAGPNSGLDGNGGALLVSDLDIAAFERPVRDLNKDARPIAGHQECRRRHDQPRRRWCDK